MKLTFEEYLKYFDVGVKDYVIAAVHGISPSTLKTISGLGDLLLKLKKEKQQYFTVLAIILNKMPNKEVTISHKLLMTFDPSLYKIEQM